MLRWNRNTSRSAIQTRSQSRALEERQEALNVPPTVSQSEILGRFYNPNTTPKDKEKVVVCLRGTGQELH